MEIEDALQKLRTEAESLSARRNALAADLERVSQELAKVTANIVAIQEVALRFGVINPSEAVSGEAAGLPAAWQSLKRQAAVLATRTGGSSARSLERDRAVLEVEGPR